MADINISVSVADGSKLPIDTQARYPYVADQYIEISPNTLYKGVDIPFGKRLAVKWQVPEGATFVDINFYNVQIYEGTFWGCWWIASRPDDKGNLNWDYARYINQFGDSTDVPIPGWYWLCVQPVSETGEPTAKERISFDFEVLVYASKEERDISDDIQNTGDEIKNQNNQTGNDIQNNVDTATDDIRKYLTDLGKTVSSLMSGIGDALGKGFEALGTAITNIISSITSAITNALSYVGELIYKAVEYIISFFGDLLSRLFDSLVSVLNSIYTTIRDFLEKIWRFIEEVVLKAVAEFVIWFIKTVESMPERIADAISSVIFEEVEE
jgi:gas vesicle protein